MIESADRILVHPVSYDVYLTLLHYANASVFMVFLFFMYATLWVMTDPLISTYMLA